MESSKEGKSASEEANQKKSALISTKEELLKAKEKLNALRQATQKQASRVAKLTARYERQQREYFEVSGKVQILPAKNPTPRKKQEAPKKPSMAKAIAKLPENLWPELTKAIGITIEDVREVNCKKQ